MNLPSIQSDTAFPIEASIMDLILLFQQHLTDVEFPELNASRLSELGKKVQSSYTTMVQLEQTLADARNAHNEAEQALLSASRAALGYARVYSEGNSELSAALASITIGKRQKGRTGTRKPRRKNKGPQTNLPLDTEIPSATTVAHTQEESRIP